MVLECFAACFHASELLAKRDRSDAPRWNCGPSFCEQITSNLESRLFGWHPDIFEGAASDLQPAGPDADLHEDPWVLDRAEDLGG